VTGYVYGVSVASGSAFASNDIIAATQYPDRVTGLPSASDVETYTVNALGERTSFTDRAGSVHAYTRDVVGRQTADTVVTLGAGVNGDIRRIEVAYETLGQALSITSFDAVTGGTAKNQVARTFAAFGKIASEAQAHKGLVDASTPRVQYIWSQGSLNTDRLTKTIYPDGAEVTVNYTGLDSNMSRITSLSGVRAGTGSSVVLEALKYLGASTAIERSRPEVNVNFSLVGSATAPGDAGDKYTGLDRFGRVTDLRWIRGTSVTSQSVERLGYTYDRNGNRLSATNALNTAFNETYTHDALNQLESFERGASGSPSATQDWQFDALGNWTTVTTDGIAEAREANAQNELTNVGGSSLAYSATGNLTTDAEGRTLEYDAWNRLIRVTSADSFTTTEYAYNGLNHRITEVSHTGSTRDLFYSLGWQVLEERVRDGAGEIPSVADTRYIWSPVYVDAMIARDRNADNDTATGSGGLEQRIYAIQGANWNTTAIIAASGVPGAANGNVINRFVYSPYGVSQTLSASWTTAASPMVTVWNHLFQGLKFTETTGLAYVRNRDYSASLGRFIERDPIGFSAGDNNWYRLLANGPTFGTDPSGLTAGQLSPSDFPVGTLPIYVPVGVDAGQPILPNVPRLPPLNIPPLDNPLVEVIVIPVDMKLAPDIFTPKSSALPQDVCDRIFSGLPQKQDVIFDIPAGAREFFGHVLIGKQSGFQWGVRDLPFGAMFTGRVEVTLEYHRSPCPRVEMQEGRVHGELKVPMPLRPVPRRR
jgi:RHS repeat-associated protein